MNIIETENLRKEYGTIVALDNVSVEIPKGAVAFLGPNGAGKTTFIKIVLGIISPTSGKYKFLGYEKEKTTLDIIRKQIGYMPEVPTTISRVTGIQFVRHMGMLTGMPFEVAMQRAHEVLDYVGLEDERYRNTKHYSTGMKQRLLLAQALVHDPDVIICDEPTSGLDPAGREDILFLLKDLVKNYGKSLFFSTHILKDVEQTCDHVILLNKGRVIYEGSLEKLKEKQKYGTQVRFYSPEKVIPLLKEKGYEFQFNEITKDIVITNHVTLEELTAIAIKAKTPILLFKPYERPFDELFMEMVSKS